MHPQFYEASVTFVMASLLALHVGSRAERSRVHGLVLGLASAMMIWTGGIALARAADSPALSLSASITAFAGIFAVPPLFLLLAAHAYGWRRLSESTRGPLLVGAPSCIALLCLASNESHHLFLRDAAALNDGTTSDWAGPLYWAWAVWGFTLVAAGAGLYLSRALRMLSGAERRRGLALGATAIVPVAASLLHNLGIDSAGYDRSPLFTGAAVSLLFFSDWRYRLISTVPVARRDVIEHLADGVVVTDALGRILDLNPAAEAMTGAHLAEVQGRPIVDVVAEQSVGDDEMAHGPFAGVVERMLAEGGDFETHVENRRGQVFEVRMAAVRIDGVATTGLYLTLRDVTKQMRFEALMRQSQRLETVAGLAAGIAHEVNNPLAYVRSNLAYVHEMTDELGGDVDKDALDEVRLVVEESIEGVDRIGRIIERVRRFSRIGSEELVLAGVNEIVGDAVRVARLGRFDSVELQLSFAAELPPVRASTEALTQAVTNLLVNAAQAVREPGGTVVVSTRAVGDEVEIRVADDGPGVDPEVRERIFDPFFTTKKTGEGTGLGLAVAFGIAREHGGTLAYDPPPEGEGAAFRIRLPAAGAAA